MKYQQPTFTLPTASGKVTQKEWDRIFGPKRERRQKGPRLSDIERAVIKFACGDCGAHQCICKESSD